LKTVFFFTLGCKVNQYESEAMEKLFLAAGYELAENVSKADVVVVNTCAVTALSTQKSRQMIRRFIRIKPDALTVVIGCYAQNSPDEISKIDGVDVIIGTSERTKIVEFVEKALANREKIMRVTDVKNISDFEELPHTPQRTRAFLKIEDGCNNFCSYCIIPYVRGRVRSRSLESIRAECEELADAGYREIVLTGIHIGAYGYDFKNKITLADAVKTVLDAANPFRLRLGSIESTEMTDALIDLMKSDSRICNHVHLPLQSGCDETLKAMRRPYTTKNFAALTERLVKEIPDISIGTDLIAGFPGESDKNFDETIDFIKSQPFSKIHVFPFSSREGTVAASMPNHVDAQIKKLRATRALEISASKEKSFAENLIGRTFEIIAETEENGFIDGLTKNYVRVYVPVNPQIKSGDIIKVTAEKFLGGMLYGKSNSD